jgi:hypothetical protein
MYAIALIDRDTNKIAGLFVSRLRVGSDLGTDLEFTSGEQLSSPTWDRKRGDAELYVSKSDAISKLNQIFSDELYSLIVGEECRGHVIYATNPEIEVDEDSDADLHRYYLKVVTLRTSFVDDEETEVTASSLGQYVGRRLMTNWTISLLVYDAEESEFYDFEESYTGSFKDCLDKAAEYFDTIEENGIDGYVTLEADRGNEYYELYNYSDLEELFPDEF